MDDQRFDTRPAVKTKLNVLPQNPDDNRLSPAVKMGRFPSWLHRKLPEGGGLASTGKIMSENRLHTVCEEAKCPNILECWSKKTATFLVLGKECTRSCGFCDIDFTKQPRQPDLDEPARVADSVKQLGLKHVVITMVARDDLSDGGAHHLVKVIEAIRKETDSTVEVLTSDFAGNTHSLDLIIEAEPEIFNHNIETVRALTPRVRHKATYERTLQVLNYIFRNKKNRSLLIKSGMMLGLGEESHEVEETILDLKNAGCDIVTIGQYLQPNRHKLRVKSFITPEQFTAYESFGKQSGVLHMFSGPFVRSSYNAGVVFESAKKGAVAIESL